MRAAVLTALNSPLQIWDVEPEPYKYDEHLRYGQVMVNMIASGICGSQLAEIAGHKDNASHIPHMLGHEGVGKIIATGLGVPKHMIGKKCVLHWRKGQGIEAPKAAYEYRSGHSTKRVGAGSVTTLCEEAIVSENRITVVPDGVPNDLCALLGCGLSTALGTVEQEAKLKFGESILIVGVGGVGRNLILAAKLAGAWPIVGMDIRNEVGPVDGMDWYVNSRNDTAKRATDHYGIKGFDVIVDTSGSTEALESTVPLLSPTGRYIMIGHPKPDESFRILHAAHMFYGEGKMIRATQGGGFRPSYDIPRYVNLWRSGALKIDGIISHRIGLDEINDGIELVRSGQAGRIMVEFK